VKNGNSPKFTDDTEVHVHQWKPLLSLVHIVTVEEEEFGCPGKRLLYDGSSNDGLFG
jgi:hypothetical protein